ncbi:MAG: isochorismatase family protein [Gemmataceae bacterium]
MPAVTRLNPAECAVLLVDFQKKLVPALEGGLNAVAKANFLAQGARALGVPVLATEQYPKGLGTTLDLLTPHLSQPAWEKTRFSAAIDPVIAWLHRDARRTVVLAGVESHICLAQTALDLIEADFAVAVVTDACAAGDKDDQNNAFMRLFFQGHAISVTVEAVLYEWLGDAAHPAFKEISALVKQSREVKKI